VEHGGLPFGKDVNPYCPAKNNTGERAVREIKRTRGRMRFFAPVKGDSQTGKPEYSGLGSWELELIHK
jgi:hypothetical protein